jgi:hypothetical protein
MAGVVEEGVKVAGGVIDALRGNPLALAMGIMNIALLLFLFYYLSRITSRTETTVQALFTANDKLYEQWKGIIKDTNDLTEKSMHCILPEDALKLLQMPARPAAPEPLQPRAQSLSSPVFLPLPPLPPIPVHDERRRQ